MSEQQSHYLDPTQQNQPTARPYSYLPTPIEAQTAVFPSRNDGDRGITSSHQQHEPDIEESEPQSPTRNRPLSYMPSVNHGAGPQSPDRVQTPTESQMIPIPPPISQHPAQFAPYADYNPDPIYQQPSPPQQNVQVPEYQPPYSMSPPVSPGPLPAKHPMTPEPQNRRDTRFEIEPDYNPLTTQSPAPAYDPNPTSKGVPTSTPLVHDRMSHTPGQVMHPQQELKGGTWKHSLCDCSDIGTCCMGMWCPCILYGRTQYRLSMKSERKDPTNLLGYETCNASCTGMALLCGCQCKYPLKSFDRDIRIEMNWAD